MDGNWCLVNGIELYDIGEDLGQINNFVDQQVERVRVMNVFYESWWEDVIKEIKFLVIELGKDFIDVIICYDV